MTRQWPLLPSKLRVTYCVADCEIRRACAVAALPRVDDSRIKIIQEVITISVFIVFAILFLKEKAGRVMPSSAPAPAPDIGNLLRAASRRTASVGPQSAAQLIGWWSQVTCVFQSA